VLKCNYLRFNSNRVAYNGINNVASFKIYYKKLYLQLGVYFVHLYYRDCCSLASWFMIFYVVTIFFFHFTYITARMSRICWYIFKFPNTLPLPHYWSIYYNPPKNIHLSCCLKVVYESSKTTARKISNQVKS
jgi:hypothetical protein